MRDKLRSLTLGPILLGLGIAIQLLLLGWYLWELSLPTVWMMLSGR